MCEFKQSKEVRPRNIITFVQIELLKGFYIEKLDWILKRFILQ